MVKPTSNSPLSKAEILAERITKIILYAVLGKSFTTAQLAEEFGVKQRTIQRDIARLSNLLPWVEGRPNTYQIDPSRLGFLTENDISQIAKFLAVSGLFPDEEELLNSHLLEGSVTIKGHRYEAISERGREYELFVSAIKSGRCVKFDYVKVTDQEKKSYCLEPYQLLNQSGVWYVLGVVDDVIKTFCFTQMSDVHLSSQEFEHDPEILARIRESDSLYIGNTLEEVELRVDARVAGYFLRRELVPNQQSVDPQTDGSLIIRCTQVSAEEILSLVQYWIPNVTISSPSSLSQTLNERLQAFLSHSEAVS